MKTRIFLSISFLIFYFSSIAQEKAQTTVAGDTLTVKKLSEVVVTATRYPSLYKLNSMATALVTPSMLDGMPKTIGADEALRFVPGVRIDNQADGSRLHMSIRGQGILSERGLRGIRVLLDGIPVNDPSGFAPDLYDVDWETLDRIEVIRGSSSSFYGGGGSAGVLNIISEAGGSKKAGGKFYATGGSNGFYKVLGQVNGTSNDLDYRITYSRMGGSGYRDHSAYWANNFAEKVVYTPGSRLSLTQVFTVTDYFNQNPEGISQEQVDENPKQANPDANPFNEYQKTNRITGGLNGQYKFNKHNDVQFYAFIRYWKYKETSNKAAQYRYFTTPGGSLQYNLHLGEGSVKNQVSLGADFQAQSIREYKFKSLANPDREESLSQTNLEDTLMLANQNITQRSFGIFLFDKLDIGRNFSLNGSIRYDYMYNDLFDYKGTPVSTSGTKTFDHVTGRVGASYSFAPAITLYASWSSGFLPPATEELASNPDGYGGFNEALQPATSQCEELGLRGFVGDKFFYDVTGFYMTTKDDFFRFKLIPARGNQEVFYGNAGDSRRFGAETYFSYAPVKPLKLQLTYTYSNFKYTSPDSLNGQWLPNSPQHQLYFDVEWHIIRNLLVGASTELQTKWSIYTDVVHKDVWQDGFNIYHARIVYAWRAWGIGGELGFYAKNIFNTKYIAFTEPDPDGNCYQPAAQRELFLSLKLNF